MVGSDFTLMCTIFIWEENMVLRSVEKHAHPPRVYRLPLLTSQTTGFLICIVSTHTSTMLYQVIKHATAYCHIMLSHPGSLVLPSRKSPPETFSWPGKCMGKATLILQLTLSHCCHKVLCEPTSVPTSSGNHAKPGKSQKKSSMHDNHRI